VGDTIGDLFRVQKEQKEFPKVFQNYKSSSDLQKAAPFAFMKQRPAQKKPFPKKMNTADTDALDFSKLKITVPENNDDDDPPYAQKTP